MTANMMKKIQEAKTMVTYFVEHKLIEDGKDVFTPNEYGQMREQWENETPTWPTLKKYAQEVGLVAVTMSYAWHSDGSLTAYLSGIKDGTIFHYTAYHF